MHILKTDPEPFTQTYNGLKNFEIRKHDRAFMEGDTILLRETKHSGAEMEQGMPLIYTGREIECEIQYILHGPQYGLKDGWIIMSIEATKCSSKPFDDIKFIEEPSNDNNAEQT